MSLTYGIVTADFISSVSCNTYALVNNLISTKSLKNQSLFVILAHCSFLLVLVEISTVNLGFSTFLQHKRVSRQC